METTVLKSNISKIIKQRNMLLLIIIPLILANVFLSCKIATTDQQVVMVPALRQEMMVSKQGISKSYLEEMSLLFLSNLLDLTPSDIKHKKELVLKYTSNSNKKSMENLIAHFRDCERKYKKFGLSTFFSVKNLEIDLENLVVIAHGMLTSYYGKTGHESENEDYRLSFEFQGGNLRLKSFVRIIDDEKTIRDQAKNMKFEKTGEEKQTNTSIIPNADDEDEE